MRLFVSYHVGKGSPLLKLTKVTAVLMYHDTSSALCAMLAVLLNSVATVSFFQHVRIVSMYISTLLLW